MRALITGITGFAGQYLTEHLVSSGDQVLGSTFGEQWNVELAPEVRGQVDVFEWDLSQPLPEQARRQVERFAPDCIYHLAAISVPSLCGASEPSPLAMAVNVGGTRAVLDLARSLADSTRVLAISSAHVYAPVTPERPMVTEQARLGPTGAYGTTKVQAEQACQQAAEDGLDVVVVRAFQHAGPRQLPMFMLPEWAEQFAAPGDGSIQVVTLDSHVDLSDVRDVVRAYRLLMACPTTNGCYNVGSGKATRSGDVFEQLEQLSGQRREAVERSPGFRQRPIADITRLVEATGWTPALPLEQTIADTLADFQKRV